MAESVMRASPFRAMLGRASFGRVEARELGGPAAALNRRPTCRLTFAEPAPRLRREVCSGPSEPHDACRKPDRRPPLRLFHGEQGRPTAHGWTRRAGCAGFRIDAPRANTPTGEGGVKVEPSLQVHGLSPPVCSGLTEL